MQLYPLRIETDVFSAIGVGRKTQVFNLNEYNVHLPADDIFAKHTSDLLSAPKATVGMI